MKSFINVGTIGALGRENDLVITPLSPRNHPLITPFGLGNASIKSLCGMWKYVASLLIVLFVGVGNVWGKTIYYWNEKNWPGIKCHNWGTSGSTWCTDEENMSGTGMSKNGHYYSKITLKHENNDYCKFYKNDCNEDATGDIHIDGNCFQGDRWINMLPIEGGTFYLDNSLLNWTPAGSNKVQLFVGDGGYTTVYDMSTEPIANTKLYYYNMSAYGGTTYIRFALANYTSNSFGPGNVPSTSTGIYEGTYEFNSSSLYVFSTETGESGTSISPEYQASGYSSLNKTITLAAKIKAAGSNEYVEGTSKGQLGASSYVFSEYNVCTTTSGNASIVAKGETTGTFSAGYTAYTTFTVSSVDDKYTFIGWYDSDGNELSNNTSYAGYRPKSETTIYAYFSEKTYDVSVGVAPIDGDIIGGTATPSTWTPFGQVTGGTITATSYVGYYFTGWEDVGGTVTDDKSSSTTFIPSKNEANATATFDYRWSIAGGTDEYSPDEMGDWNINTNLIAHIGRNASSKDTGYVNIDLPANTNFQFLIKDRETDDWYKNGYQDSDPIYYMTYTNHTNWDFGTDKKHNCGITTAGAGTYKFAWNITDKLLTVYFPSSYKVTYNPNGATSGSAPTDDDYYASETTVTVATNSGDLEKTGYTFGGWNTEPDGTGTTYVAGTGTFAITANTTLYAKWNPVSSTFTTEGNWSTASNWSPACVPAITSNVVITKPVTVDVKTARANNVVLDQKDGNTGKLIINAGKELVIAGELRKKTDVSEDSPTEAEDIVINSDASNGLGALVMGSHDGTNQATVNFYTLSHGTSGSSASVAQYVGVPFTDATVLSAFYNSWVYKFSHTEEPSIAWDRVSESETLRTFKGYCVFSADGAGHTYEMQGTLAPSENQDLNLYYNGGDQGNPNNETLLANSWMAPIKIAAFEPKDFTDAHAAATIYIFNAGSLDNYKAAGGDPDDNTFVIGDGPGQYSTYPIGTAGNAVIPAMQSFSVFTNTGASLGDDNHLILDYNRLVYAPAVAGTTPVANRSPRRAKAETSEREEMLLCVRGANGPADRVRILAHEDFDEGFENGWDGHKIFGESFTPQLYAMTTDGNMAVNCIPEYEGTVLGFKPSDVDNSYTFYFRYDGDETLYLNDLKTEQSTLIQDENTYPFTSSTEDAEARFVISATPIPHTPTGIQSVQSDGEQGAKARKLFINGAIYIIRSGRMYDVLGKTMRNEK